MRMRGLGLAIVLVVALAGAGDFVLGMKSPETASDEPPICGALRFTLDQAKIGFSEIKGEQMGLPYTTGNVIATRYRTIFRFPKADWCTLTLQPGVMPQFDCGFGSGLDVVRKETEPCLMGVGGWVNNSAYSQDVFINGEKSKIVLDASGTSGRLTIW